ncbi:MAG: acyclic terpene utilization AtuA family protein [Anaerolineaceae bacterium]|nr:MAG: acyclic terpene utilization AtuA family protein [Anaerolineaceae bacterium]
MNGMKMKPDAIVVDAGSTDAGPHKLGEGVSIVSKVAVKKDLSIIISNGIKSRIPIIIGSAGGAGAKVHVEWTLDIVYEILRENSIVAKLAIIYSDIDKEVVTQAIHNNRIFSMGSNIPSLTEDILSETNSIVAQMGHEPIIEALEKDVDIIVCGRAYDPSIFAAVGIHAGFEPGLSYHMGKVLECGALCAEPGTTKDCIMGTLYEDSFSVNALNPLRSCNVTSVAAHTFYEKENPCILHGPGFTLDLTECTFLQENEETVRIKGSRYIPDDNYKVKIEGARQRAYRTIVIGAIRDPILISRLQEIEDKVSYAVREYFNEIPEDEYTMNYYNYGINGVMGNQETQEFKGHEVCVLFEVLAKTQDLADTICSYMRSTFLHCDYEGRKTTAGNLAFPFAPSDISFGPVYEFCIYHLMQISDGKSLFPIIYKTYGKGELNEKPI